MSGISDLCPTIGLPAWICQQEQAEDARAPEEPALAFAGATPAAATRGAGLLARYAITGIAGTALSGIALAASAALALEDFFCSGTAGRADEETITAYPPGHPAALEPGPERITQTWQQAEQPGYPTAPSSAPDEHLGGHTPSSKKIATPAADSDRARAQAEDGNDADGDDSASTTPEDRGKQLFGRHAVQDDTGFHGPGLPVIEGLDGTWVRDMRSEVYLDGTKSLDGQSLDIATEIGASGIDGWGSTPLSGKNRVDPLPPHRMSMWFTEEHIETDRLLMNRAARTPVYSSFTYDDGNPVLLFGGHSTEAYASNIVRRVQEEFEKRGSPFEMPPTFEASATRDPADYAPSRLAAQPGRTEDRVSSNGRVRRHVIGTNFAQMSQALEEIRRNEPELPETEAVNRAFQGVPLARLAELLGYSTTTREPPRVGPRSISMRLLRKDREGE